ncbi:hypothetical protein [Capnocytophaga stomatis]|uniref:hypothetical protein n=1 Tax=Capnocytophaga stomatis TaxID=1848904 RepID=UPI001950CD96|nr:hypothetical protein [Capnocytophaga stomatis]
MKKFVFFKNSCIFATSFAKRCYVTLIVSVFFYIHTVSAPAVNIQGYQTPFTNYTTSKYGNCLLAKTEGDSLSSIYLVINFFRKMPKDREITLLANDSSEKCTLHGAKSETSTKFSQQDSNSLSFCNRRLFCCINNYHFRVLIQSVFSEFIDNGLIDLENSKLT